MPVSVSRRGSCLGAQAATSCSAGQKAAACRSRRPPVGGATPPRLLHLAGSTAAASPSTGAATHPTIRALTSWALPPTTWTCVRRSSEMLSVLPPSGGGMMAELPCSSVRPRTRGRHLCCTAQQSVSAALATAARSAAGHGWACNIAVCGRAASSRLLQRTHPRPTHAAPALPCVPPSPSRSWWPSAPCPPMCLRSPGCSRITSSHWGPSAQSPTAQPAACCLQVRLHFVCGWRLAGLLVVCLLALPYGGTHCVRGVWQAPPLGRVLRRLALRVLPSLRCLACVVAASDLRLRWLPCLAAGP